MSKPSGAAPLPGPSQRVHSDVLSELLSVMVEHIGAIRGWEQAWEFGSDTREGELVLG